MAIERKQAESIGIDINAGVERFMGNEDLYERFLHKFADDVTYSELIAAFSENNCKAAFNAAHTLKGVCGNLSLVRLYELAARMTEYLRSGDMDMAKSMTEDLSAAYKAVLDFITSGR